MSSPFSRSSRNGQPVWTVTLPTNANFSPLYGKTNYAEVGYGEGGFGQDGYDTPSTNFPDVPQPVWTVIPARVIYGAMILLDSGGNSWTVTIDTTGHLVTTLGGVYTGLALPQSQFYDNLISLWDGQSEFWQVTVLPSGDLVTSVIPVGYSEFEEIFLSDSSGHIWTLTVLPTGNLDTN